MLEAKQPPLAIISQLPALKSATHCSYVHDISLGFVVSGSCGWCCPEVGYQHELALLAAHIMAVVGGWDNLFSGWDFKLGFAA